MRLISNGEDIHKPMTARRFSSPHPLRSGNTPSPQPQAWGRLCRARTVLGHKSWHWHDWKPILARLEAHPGKISQHPTRGHRHRHPVLLSNAIPTLLRRCWPQPVAGLLTANWLISPRARCSSLPFCSSPPHRLLGNEKAGGPG